MKIVEWTDDDGYKHLSLLRDSDPDSMAEAGIPRDPPDLGLLDWEEIKREIHNQLVSRRILTWEDAQRSQNGVGKTVRSVVGRRIIALMRNNYSMED